MDIRLYSMLPAPNKIMILGEWVTIPSRSEFKLDLRYWAEIKRLKSETWVKGGFLYPVSDSEEHNLIESYESELSKKFAQSGVDQVKQLISSGKSLTRYEIDFAQSWIAKELDKKSEISHRIDVESLSISKKSERHARRANVIALLALIISLASLIVSLLGE